MLPFGVSPGYFAVVSETLALTAPGLTAARTAVLDYFAAQSRLLRPDHLLFQCVRVWRAVRLGSL